MTGQNLKTVSSTAKGNDKHEKYILDLSIIMLVGNVYHASIIPYTANTTSSFEEDVALVLN
jgi:hypothetical protein